MRKKHNIDTFLLTLLAEGPMHGYEIVRYLTETGFDRWINAPASSVYQSLRRMASQGYLKKREIRVRKSPPRTVYELTENGRKALEEAIEKLLETPVYFYDEYSIAVFGLEVLDKERFLLTLEGQKTATALHIREIEKTLSEVRVKAEPRLVLIYERLMSLYKAHHRWLKDAAFIVKKRQ